MTCAKLRNTTKKARYYQNSRAKKLPPQELINQAKQDFPNVCETEAIRVASLRRYWLGMSPEERTIRGKIALAAWSDESKRNFAANVSARQKGKPLPRVVIDAAHTDASNAKRADSVRKSWPLRRLKKERGEYER